MTTQREAATAPRFDRGTPETRGHAKKRGPGTIQALIERGTIGGYEVRALEEMVSVYKYTVSRLEPQIMAYDERRSPSFSSSDPAWYRDAYVNRYKPWALLNPRDLTLIIMVAIDGHSFRELAQKWINRHTVKRVFVQALRDYAISAGWVDSNTLDDWRREST